MRVARLAAAGTAAGLVVLGAGAPALAQEDPATPTPTPTATEPAFKFGFDKVQLSTRRVVPGGKVTFTVTCPTAVTATSSAFVANPRFAKDGDTSKGTATYKRSLPRVVNIKVSCAKFGFVTFSTKSDTGNGGGNVGNGPNVPDQAPDTGGGATAENGAAALGGAAALAIGLMGATGLGLVAARRRMAREEA
jgi:hypothetical protein